MSTLEATVSMLEALPEDAKMLVYKYTQSLFAADQAHTNPFLPLTEEQILSDLAQSRQEIADGKGVNMKEALAKMGEKHGFIRSDRNAESTVSA